MPILYRLSLTSNHTKTLSKQVTLSHLEDLISEIIMSLKVKRCIQSQFFLTIQSFDPSLLHQTLQAVPYEVDMLAEQIMLFDNEGEMRSFVQTEKVLSSNPMQQLTDLSIALIKLSQRLSAERRESGITDLPQITHLFSKEQLDNIQQQCYHNLSIIRQRRKKTDMCVICWQKYAQKIMMPCMHLAVCGGCSQYPLDRCPMCKTRVKEIKQVFR